MLINKVLVRISGWGSQCQILDPLLAHCPELAHHKRLDLAWQDFVSITDTSQRRQALLSTFEQKYLSSIQGPIHGQGKNPSNPESHLSHISHQWEIADMLILGWSLGGLLALELNLAINHQQANPKRPRLLLLSPTAAMCGPALVPPIILKMMQQKLNQANNSVLLDFAANLGDYHGHHGADKEWKQLYLKQAQSFSTEQLIAGLTYLISCDLREELGGLQNPSLLISGTHDKIIPVQQSQALAQLLGNAAKLQLLEAGGHCSPLLAGAQCKQPISDLLQSQK